MRKILLVIPILLALFYTTSLTLTQGLSIGVDINFHLDIARSWASGNIGMISPAVMDINGMPYPPLFHWLLALGTISGFETAWAMILQIILAPLAVAAFMFLVYKQYGTTLSFFSGFIVLSSTAYLDRVIQPQPQALDFMLLPLAFYGFLFLKSKAYLLSSVLMVWNHGIVSLSALGGTLIGYLKRRNIKLLLAFALGVSIVLAITLYYLIPSLTQFQSSNQNDQEYYFWHLPLFTPAYLGFITIGLPIAIYKGIQWIRKKPVTSIDKLSIATILSTAIMIPMWADRWLQYITIPLSLLVLSQVSSSNKTIQKLWFMMIILFYFANGTFALSIRLLL